MFISFEGIDGSGKSTQARRLAERLVASGCRVVEVREPGGTPLAEGVRGLLLDPSLRIDPFAEMLLFSAARAQLVAEVVRPALAEGAWVLSDRFFDSTIAYQGAGRALSDAAWLRDFQHRVTGGLVPDRTFLLRVPPEVAASRRAAQADRMEAAGEAFYARVAAAYDALARAEPQRVRVLDGCLPPDVLHAQVWDDLAPAFGTGV